MAKDLKLPISPSTLQFAEEFRDLLVPSSRFSGFADVSKKSRGLGDVMDLIGSLVVFKYLTSNDIACSVNITSGKGDEWDLCVFKHNRPVTFNIKTSQFAPFRKGLNLFIKEEETRKPADGYIQVFIHAGEGGEEPHAHIAGYFRTTWSMWEDFSHRMTIIPHTGGHRGAKVPVEELQDIRRMLDFYDQRL
jgi:hypothetical protein